MKRIAIALGAIAALALAAFALGGTVQAQTPNPPGMDINGPAGGVVGVPFNMQIHATGTAPLDAFTGYQSVIIYDGAVLTVNSFTENAQATYAWTTVFSPPPSLNVGNVLLPPGWLGSGGGTTLLVGTAATTPGLLATWALQGVAAGASPVHQVSLAAGGPTFGSFTIDTASAPQANAYTCSAAVCIPSPLTTPPGAYNDAYITIVLPPPDVSVTKTASVASLVAGQPMSFTITWTNHSATNTANTTMTDTFPAAFTALAMNPANANCTLVGQVLTCTETLAPGASDSVTVDTVVDSNAGGTSPQNCASVSATQTPDPNPNNNSSCVTVQIIPPAVAWNKSVSVAQTFLTAPGTGVVTFDEIMVNQGDPNGLGGFEFTLNYDNTIWQTPTIDLSPAMALFAASGRVLDCSITQVLETQVHVACASTGPIGVGPVWVGPQVMAHVSLTARATAEQAIRPSKENGIVTWVKDTAVEPANTCGWPLNDGTATPLPGQTSECQGNPLLGILPGGQIANSDSEVVITLRRLEGDVNRDCKVDVSDMQIEASKYGQTLGSLLYNVWFDLEPNLPHGDGDIDIKDVQFVYGRFGSTCANPIPAQVPQPLP